MRAIISELVYVILRIHVAYTVLVIALCVIGFVVSPSLLYLSMRVQEKAKRIREKTRRMEEARFRRRLRRARKGDRDFIPRRLTAFIEATKNTKRYKRAPKQRAILETGFYEQIRTRYCLQGLPRGLEDAADTPDR